MKKALIIGALLASSTGLFAQGTVQFSDIASTFTIHIYQPNPANPSVEIQGNAANDKPVGATSYAGLTPVGGSGTGTGLGNGSEVTVQIEASGGGTSAVALNLLSPVSQYTTTAYTLAAGAGLFVKPAIATDTGIPNSQNGNATVAIAAWYNNGGSITSLAAAQAASGGIWGESQASFITGLGNPQGSPPTTPPALSGITSFSLTQVSSSPEPSTIALGVMGASAFLLRRRMAK
jgi:hypothetical protein